MSEHTVYAIASGKGGVGKTTTTVNLGTAMAGAGNRVVIVDVDLGMANLAGFVDLDPSDATLHEVLSGDADLGDAVYDLPGGISAVPSGIDLDGYADVKTEGLCDVVARLREEYDYVLLDVGAGISHETVLPLGLADRVLLVSTPEPASVQDARKTLDLTSRASGTVAGLVLTRVLPGSDVSYEDVADRLGVDLLATIPEDTAVRQSVYAGTPLVVHAPKSAAAKAYKILAARLLGHSEERGPTLPLPDGADADAADRELDDGDVPTQDSVRDSIREAEREN